MDNTQSLLSESYQFIERHDIGKNSTWFKDYAFSRKLEYHNQILNILRIRDLVKSERPRMLDVGSAPFILPLACSLSNLFGDVYALDLDTYRFDNTAELPFSLLNGDIDRFDSIEINDTLQISKEQGFPKELDLEAHLKNPLNTEDFKDRIFEFTNKPEIRMYKVPPVRNFLVENRDGKWIYWGLVHILEVHHDY